VAERPKDTEHVTHRRPPNYAGVAYQGSVEAVLSILIGAGLGYAADRYLSTAPWLMVLGLSLGFAAFVRRLMSLARQLDAREKAPRNGDRQDPT